jgi:hypothetical protein
MLTLQQYLKQTSSPCDTAEHKKTLQEGTELSASDLFHKLTAPQAQSICATVIADTDEELTLHLQVTKWGRGSDALSPRSHCQTMTNSHINIEP